MNSFADLALLPTLRGTLVEKNLTKPTEIQSQAVPALLAGRSVVGVAETGSGKTLAYALPILHRLKTLELQGNPITVYGEPRAIVMVPTRELGEQVAKAFKPDLLFITCGADGLTDDPLTNLQYTVTGYAAAAALVAKAFPATPFLMGGAGGYLPDSGTPEVWSAVASELAANPKNPN
jgi:superfamily II DNA or RNA helicase